MKQASLSGIYFALLLTLFSMPLRGQGQQIGGLGSVRVNPLDPAERSNWDESSGEWKFETSALTGSGDARITYGRTFTPPFRMTFDIEVIEGVRPRVLFGRYSLAHEGFGSRQFGLYPSHDKSRKFDYTTGKKYPVQIDITKDRIEVRIAGKVIDTRNVGMDVIPSIKFSAGDPYSKGTARFSNISVVSGQPPTPKKP